MPCSENMGVLPYLNQNKNFKKQKDLHKKYLEEIIQKFVFTSHMYNKIKACHSFFTFVYFLVFYTLKVWNQKDPTFLN